MTNAAQTVLELELISSFSHVRLRLPLDVLYISIDNA